MFEFWSLVADATDATAAAETSIGQTLSRGVHLLAAMLAVGALVFQRVALRPALATVDQPELAESIRRRWAPVTHIVITLLIATGLYQLMTVGMTKGRVDSTYHMWFGIKFVAAMGVFFLASALGGRSRALEVIRNRPRRWLGVAILLAVVVVALSLHLRNYAATSA